MSNKIVQTLNKEINKRDFLMVMGGVMTFFSLGGITSLFTALSGNSAKSKKSGYGVSGYGS